MSYKKKLIEVALPLEAINAASAREKSIRHGHPSTLHLWWSRKPLATCRAVLFASLVDDPSSNPEKFPTEDSQEKERQRLFRVIEDLVQWENSNNETVLAKARAEILNSTNNNPPPIYDPFCGGGSILLEAQRLGLQAYGSDLNPVAVLITKGLVEIPALFANWTPVNPEARAKQIGAKSGWRKLAGLAEDIRYYGQWMRGEAEKRIGGLFPKVRLANYDEAEAKVIAWLWARTVKCPNPACGCKMPLTSKFSLSTKKGKEAWVEPVVDSNSKTVNFQVRIGQGKVPEGTVNRRGAKCICCGMPVPFEYIRSEGRAGRIDAQLMAIVAEGKTGRSFVSPNREHEKIAFGLRPDNIPDTNLPEKALSFRVQVYGMTKHCDLFTYRQLVTLTTFSDLVNEVREKIIADASDSGLEYGLGLSEGGSGAKAYAEAIGTYLAFGVSRLSNTLCTLARWTASREQTVTAFARQAIPMTWDYPEVNPFSGAAGDLAVSLSSIQQTLANLESRYPGKIVQMDATSDRNRVEECLISTDPPYYDNIGYADLSDYFYIWLRRSLNTIFPDLFSTMLVPKATELVATPYRFGGNKDKAKEFFEDGLKKAFAAMRKTAQDDLPLTVYYAFKQADTDEDEEDSGVHNNASTGWETMLQALLTSGFKITGTWPMRSEMSNRPVASGTNALASSIVLVCRPRQSEAPIATRREFVNAMRRELPHALHELQQGNIAPVDLAQSAIGPGMAIFSSFSKVLEADGEPMSVRTALQIINQELDSFLAAQEGELDGDTRFCVAWFEQFRMNEALFGEADVLARAKNTAVDRLVGAGILSAAKGKVCLLTRNELDDNWNPENDHRVTIWRCTQQLVKVLIEKGEEAAAHLASRMGTVRADRAKSLAYRLYNICERRGWADEGLAYNTLVVSWPAIQILAAEHGNIREQGGLF